MDWLLKFLNDPKFFYLNARGSCKEMQKKWTPIIAHVSITNWWIESMAGFGKTFIFKIDASDGFGQDNALLWASQKKKQAKLICKILAFRFHNLELSDSYCTWGQLSCFQRSKKSQG